jgi:glycosyltransferase involved in cell wall biosynthesis
VERSIAAKTRVIPNGIELERFSNHSRYLHARPYVLAYGRLVHKKGFDLLIRAFAQVAPDFADTDLLIAGEGDQRAALDQLCAQSGISGRVHFCGRAGQSEIVRLLNGCRLMVIPSRQEPFGIAALEALAAGKPMLATRVGGLPEVARGPYVTVVEPTVTGLVAGLRERLGAPLAAPARRTPLAWSRVAEQYLALYSGHVTPEPACCEVLGASSL